MTAKRGLHSTAAIMAAHDDVTHLQDIDRKLNHRQTVEIGMDDKVGNIPVDEYFSWKQIDDYVRRDAAKALGHFGADAKPAVPALQALLHDKEPSVRKAAAETLKKIDPNAAPLPTTR